jgi:hypothetical protein
VATLLLLSGVAVDRAVLRAHAKDAGPYHRVVLARSQTIPYQIGNWFGTDTPVPPAAVSLLHPNVIVSRRYEQLQTGRQASVLLVQCSDARDILGHYPPVCYKAHGWTQTGAAQKDWQVDDLLIQGVRYEFSSLKVERTAQLVIYNFMLLPDGRTCRDMDGIDRIAQDRQKRYFGAAQLQFVFDNSGTEDERKEFFERVVRANRSLIDTIRSGASL